MRRGFEPNLTKATHDCDLGPLGSKFTTRCYTVMTLFAHCGEKPHGNESVGDFADGRQPSLRLYGLSGAASDGHGRTGKPNVT